MTLNLQNTYQGASFFDNWVYNYSAIDNTTQGNVHYLDKPNAEKQNLTYVNDAGNAIMRVDNFTDGSDDPSFGRNSVKLVSKDAFDIGSMVVMDASHLPYGESVWGAFWTLNNLSKQDDDGEIDIFEGVNGQESNRVALHTREGCTQSNTTDVDYTGQVMSTDCYYRKNGNEGCSYESKDNRSYGKQFADNDGGVMAMSWDGKGIQMWFWSRAEIPESIKNDSPDPHNGDLGSPMAYYPASSCNPREYFEEQNLVMDITLCGLWAGETYNANHDDKCASLVPDPSNYDNAYFEIRSVKTFSGGITEVEGAQDGGSEGNKSGISHLLLLALSGLIYFVF